MPVGVIKTGNNANTLLLLLLLLLLFVLFFLFICLGLDIGLWLRDINKD